MGNHHSASQLHQESKLAASKCENSIPSHPILCYPLPLPFPLSSNSSAVDSDELFILKATWTVCVLIPLFFLSILLQLPHCRQDLAERNQGRGIDKDTFLQYFPLSGLLGGESVIISFLHTLTPPSLPPFRSLVLSI
jgi:hypothetical protein